MFILRLTPFRDDEDWRESCPPWRTLFGAYLLFVDRTCDDVGVVEGMDKFAVEDKF